MKRQDRILRKLISRVSALSASSMALGGTAIARAEDGDLSGSHQAVRQMRAETEEALRLLGILALGTGVPSEKLWSFGLPVAKKRFADAAYTVPSKLLNFMREQDAIRGGSAARAAGR